MQHKPSDAANEPPSAAQAEGLLVLAAAADLMVMPDRWRLGPAQATVSAQQPAFATAAAALDWLEQQLPTLRAAIIRAHQRGLHELAWQLCEAMWPLFLFRRHYDDWVATHEIGVQAARSGRTPRAVPRMMVALASAYCSLHRFDEAAALCEEALHLERTGGHTLGEAAALHGLGVAYLGLKRPEHALDLFDQARRIHTYLGRKRGIALIARRMGEAERMAGRPQQATLHLHQAYRLFSELNDLYNEARTLTELGRTHVALGRPRSARAPLETALVLALQMGALHQQASAQMLLGQVLRTLGHHFEADKHLAEAQQVFDALGAPEAQNVQGSGPEEPTS
ncbi:tetratricopeptide repeat protein [Sphaerisporangium sp. NPDC049003]|uniref:tetratricopeptide repeat protein n=1 Tax=Sphaerisporangium sp. NPDC049003 TaxID=3364517 RepID=UPI00371721BF